MNGLRTRIRKQLVRTVAVGVATLSLIIGPLVPYAGAQVFGLDSEPVRNLRFEGTSACGGATNVSPLVLLWDVDPDAVGYEYKELRPGDTDWSVARDLDEPTGRYELPTVTQGLYQVALRPKSNPALYNTQQWTDCRVVYDSEIPGRTELVAPDSGAAISESAPVSLVWRTNDTDPARYTYEVRITQSPPDDQGILQDDPVANPIVQTTSYELTDLSTGTWYWQVRAIDDATNTGEWSIYRQFVVEAIPVTSPSDPDEAPLIIVPDNPTPLAPILTVPELIQTTAQPVTSSTGSDSDEIGSVFGRGDADVSIETILPATSEVLGLTDSPSEQQSSATVQATPSGWKVLGVLWYWWLAGIGVIILAARFLKGVFTSLSIPTPADT